MKLQIASEAPIEPRCSHFRVCGGCQYQHIPYDEQLTQKRAFISHCFSREALPIIPCDPQWRYRNKMEFSFSQAKSGEKFLGLMKRRGRVENLHECYLTTPWFLEVLTNVREWWMDTTLNAYHPPSNQGHLRTLTLREGVRTGEKMVLLTVSEEQLEETHLSSFVENLPAVDAVILRRQILQKKTPTRFEERVLFGKDHIHELLYDDQRRPFHFRIKAASFFQPNTFQAEVIYNQAIALARLENNEKVLDLYCGTGSLGIFAASHVSQVLGIELVKEAVEDAHVNLSLNSISNMEVMQGDVGLTLSQLSFQPNTLIVDPPRIGLGLPTLMHLLKFNPEKIVYVSCNPVTQAADCQVLCQGGYKIECLQPIDQFPHTPHVENIVRLTRS